MQRQMPFLILTAINCRTRLLRFCQVILTRHQTKPLKNPPFSPFSSILFISAITFSHPSSALQTNHCLLFAMGLSSSKLNAAEGETKSRPMSVGRFEEFIKRKETPSKKKLLKDADEETDNSLSSRQTETEYKFSSPRVIQPPKEGTTVVQAITAEKLSRVVPMPNSECKIVENNHLRNINKVNKDMDPNHMVKTEERTKEQQVSAKGDDHDDDSDDEDESEQIGRLICPGSPSFRIYCIQAEKINDEKCNSNSPTISVHQKSHSADSVKRAAPRNLKEEVGIESESTKKIKGKKKKFRVVRTLLKVKSCYHPIRACTGDDKILIVAAKPAK
ncbi:hypothetical protein CR513_48799, partial [Mucuna pruriens]